MHCENFFNNYLNEKPYYGTRLQIQLPNESILYR